MGFNSELADEQTFFHAANLAFSRLRTLIPLRKTVDLSFFSHEPVCYRKQGESFNISSPEGISFYFEYIGSVTVTYRHGSDVFKEKLVNPSAAAAVKKRAFDTAAPLTVEFSGDGFHKVANACIYGELSSSGEAECYSDIFSYDMSLQDGFLSVLRADTAEYSMNGTVISFPKRGNSFECSVEYSYCPEPLSEDTMNAELGIDPCLGEAAVLLTAYYILMDDDAQKSENYRREYEYSVKEILKRRHRESEPVLTNAW